MERPQHVDELLPEPVLERHALAVDPPRDQQHLLVLDVHALDRADAFREVEHLGLGERLRREPAALFLPDHRRVEALLDRRPDGEGRRELVALDDDVRAVADTCLVDLGEQVIGGVAGEDVREAGLDAHADESQQAGRLPRLLGRELLVAELHARSARTALRMRLGQRHRHVEVRAASLERRREDRRVEARVDGVEDRVGVRLAGERHDGGGVGGVHLRGAEAVRLAELLDDGLGACQVVVSEDHVLEERAPLRDRADGRPDTPRTDYEDPHSSSG